MMERLDWAFANEAAIRLFNQLQVHNVDFGTSDHLLIFLTTNGEELIKRRKGKRRMFETFWGKMMGVGRYWRMLGRQKGDGGGGGDDE